MRVPLIRLSLPALILWVYSFQGDTEPITRVSQDPSPAISIKIKGCHSPPSEEVQGNGHDRAIQTFLQRIGGGDAEAKLEFGVTGYPLTFFFMDKWKLKTSYLPLVSVLYTVAYVSLTLTWVFPACGVLESFKP